MIHAHPLYAYETYTYTHAHTHTRARTNTHSHSHSLTLTLTLTRTRYHNTGFPRYIGVGSDADICVLNPNATKKISVAGHHSAMDTNVYDGWEIKGKVETTLSQGKVVWHDDKLTAVRGAGRYIKCKPWGPMFEGIEKKPVDSAPGSIAACTRIV